MARADTRLVDRKPSIDAGGHCNVDPSNQFRGQMSHLAGAAAEERVALEYQRRGYAILERRWRGQAAEIDLILEGVEGLVFVEVKMSKTFDHALANLSRRQVQRIYRAAEEFTAERYPNDIPELRFDVALLDALGAVQILENVVNYD